MTRALVRRPGPRLPEGLVAHSSGARVDIDLAGRQWRGYVDALRAEGWEIIEVPPANDCPDAVFVEDTVVDLRRPRRHHSSQAPTSASPRSRERGRALASLGYRIAQIEPPGTLDGGDVLKGAGVVWVGLSGRTNASGAGAARGPARAAGRAGDRRPRRPDAAHEVVSDRLFPTAPSSASSRSSMIPRVWPSFLSVPEEAGAHVVVLDASAVLMSARAPATRALFESRGLRVVAVDIHEYEKLDGGVTCLSVRLRG